MNSSKSDADNLLLRAFELLEHVRLSLLDKADSESHLLKKELSRIRELRSCSLIQKYVEQRETIPNFIINDFLQELDTSPFASGKRTPVQFSKKVPTLSEIATLVRIKRADPDRRQLYFVKSVFAKLVQESVRVNNEALGAVTDGVTTPPAVSEFEFDGERIEARPIKNVVIDEVTDTVRSQTIDAQMQEVGRLLNILVQDQSVQVGILRTILEDYRIQLSERNFIRADVIFQGIRHEEIRSVLFEIDQAWLDLLITTHDGLRGFFPEFQIYMEAALRGKESQTRLGRADQKLSEAVIRTPPGEELLAESVRKVVAEIEAQGDVAKAVWDSKGVAARLEYVLKMLPEAAKVGTAAEQLNQLFEKYLGSPPPAQ